jgi:catechol 2,3-dioxygenase-like lactoylglutathione lyase family enzyme
MEKRDGYNNKSYPVFEVENIEEVRRYLEENGVSMQDEKPILGVVRFSFRDPFGNRIEFLSKMSINTCLKHF